MSVSADSKSIAGDLYAAILAVNHFPLQSALSVVQQLEGAEHTDPAVVSEMSVGRMSEALQAAGYRRGEYMNALMAQRIVNAAVKLVAGGMDEIRQHELSGDIQALRRVLLSINGVGPQVLNTFLALRAETQPARSSL